MIWLIFGFITFWILLLTSGAKFKLRSSAITIMVIIVIVSTFLVCSKKNIDTDGLIRLLALNAGSFLGFLIHLWSFANEDDSWHESMKKS